MNIRNSVVRNRTVGNGESKLNSAKRSGRRVEIGNAKNRIAADGKVICITHQHAAEAILVSFGSRTEFVIGDSPVLV